MLRDGIAYLIAGILIGSLSYTFVQAINAIC